MAVPDLILSGLMTVLSWGMTAFGFIPALWNMPHYPRSFLTVSRRGIVDGVLLGCIKVYFEEEGYESAIHWNRIVPLYWAREGQVFEARRLKNRFTYLTNKARDLGNDLGTEASINTLTTKDMNGM